MVIDRSADVATVVVAVSELLAPFGSLVEELMVAVFDRTVPAAVDGATSTTSVKKSTVTPKEELLHETVPVPPTAGVVHDQGPVVESETNVVFAGTVSDSAADAPWLGPALVTVMVYVTSLPAVTGSGVSTWVIDRSAEAVPIVVVAVAELLPGLGSVVDAPTVAVFDSTVPAAVDDATATVNVKSAVLPAATDAREHDTAPVPPTAGVKHDQPPGDESETNVVFAGSVSDSETDAASLGPALLTVMV